MSLSQDTKQQMGKQLQLLAYDVDDLLKTVIHSELPDKLFTYNLIGGIGDI